MSNVNRYSLSNFGSVVSILIPVGIILMNLVLVRVASFEVTIGTTVFMVCFLTYFLLGSISRRSLVIICLLLMYCLVGATVAPEAGEFLRTFTLVTLLLVFTSLLACSPMLDSKVIIQGMRFFLYLSCFVAILLTVDFVMINVFSLTQLSNPLGPLKSLGPGLEIYMPSLESTLGRPSAVFSEPSVASWTMAFACSIAIVLDRIGILHARMLGTICFLGMLATVTVSAYVNAIAIIGATVLTASGSRLQRLGSVTIAFVGIAMLVALVFYVGVAERFINFAEEGSSIYYRVVAPLLLLGDSLVDYPFGYPLGQVEYIESKNYMVNWLYGSSTNIDNSFFMVAFYFGYLGIAIGAVALSYLALLIRRKSDASIVLVAVYLMLLETGSLWSPNVALVIGFSILVIRMVRGCERSEDGYLTLVERRNSRDPRSPNTSELSRSME